MVLAFAWGPQAGACMPSSHLVAQQQQQPLLVGLQTTRQRGDVYIVTKATDSFVMQTDAKGTGSDELHSTGRLLPHVAVCMGLSPCLLTVFVAGSWRSFTRTSSRRT